MNDATMNFSGMRDTARQIFTLATLLGMNCDSVTEDLLEDAALMLQEKAEALGQMIEDAAALAKDLESAAATQQA